MLGLGSGLRLGGGLVGMIRIQGRSCLLQAAREGRNTSVCVCVCVLMSQHATHDDSGASE